MKETDGTGGTDGTDGAIGVLVSTPLKNLMLLMFFMKMENLIQFLNFD